MGTERSSGTERIKLYLEARLSDPEEDTAHLAWKWTSGRSEVRTDRYVRRQPNSTDDVLALVAEVARGVPAVRSFVDAVLQVDPHAGDDPSWGFLVVDGPAGGRRSFDLRTSLDRRMRVGDLGRALDRVEQELAPGTVRWWTEELSGATVVRVAGGIDADGVPFLTLYHGWPRRVSRTRDRTPSGA